MLLFHLVYKVQSWCQDAVILAYRPEAYELGLRYDMGDVLTANCVMSHIYCARVSVTLYNLNFHIKNNKYKI